MSNHKDHVRDARDAMLDLLLSMTAWRAVAEKPHHGDRDGDAAFLVMMGESIDRAALEFNDSGVWVEILDEIGARFPDRVFNKCGVQSNCTARATFIMARRFLRAVWMFESRWLRDGHGPESIPQRAEVLTELAQYVRDHLPDFDVTEWQTAVRDEFGLLLGDPPATATDRPSWTTETRTLAFCGSTYVIKHNSGDHIEAIFRAFAEANWPPRIESPLPGNVRTSSVLQSINNAMARCGVPLRFKGDGTKSIAWETVRMQRHATE